MHFNLGRENSRFCGDSVDFPLSVGVGFSVVFALSLQMEQRVDKQKMKHPFNESAIVYAQDTLKEHH